MRRVDEMGYRGDYSFEVFNDDYRTLPLPMVAERAQPLGEVAHRPGVAPQPAAAAAGRAWRAWLAMSAVAHGLLGHVDMIAIGDRRSSVPAWRPSRR